MRPTQNDVSCLASVSHGQGQQTTGHYSWLQQKLQIAFSSIIANIHKWLDKCQSCDCRYLLFRKEKESSIPSSIYGVIEGCMKSIHLPLVIKGLGGFRFTNMNIEYMFYNSIFPSCIKLLFNQDIIHSFLSKQVKNPFLFTLTWIRPNIWFMPKMYIYFFCTLNQIITFSNT